MRDRAAAAENDAGIAHAAAENDGRIAIAQSYYGAILEVAKGSVDRARASAETVQKASPAIATLYTGILALAFSVAENPLPEKALYAALLLGLAILLSTAFLACLPSPEPADDGIAASSIDDAATFGERLTTLFVRWTRRSAYQRGRLLRGSVVALAGAVLLMPAPFVTLGAAPAPSDPIDWPTPDPAAGTDVALAKILYTAQLAETVAQRKEPIARDDTSWPWTAAFVVVLAIGLCVMVFPLPAKEKEDGTAPPPASPAAA